MKKVCPKCKLTNRVVETSYPTQREITFSIEPSGRGFKEVLVKDHLDYSESLDFPVLTCANCGHEYEGLLEDIWEEMVGVE